MEEIIIKRKKKVRKRPPSYPDFLSLQMLIFGLTPKDIKIRRTKGDLATNTRIKVGWEGKGYDDQGNLVVDFWEESFELACVEIVRQCTEQGLKVIPR